MVRLRYQVISLCRFEQYGTPESAEFTGFLETQSFIDEARKEIAADRARISVDKIEKVTSCRYGCRVASRRWPHGLGKDTFDWLVFYHLQGCVSRLRVTDYYLLVPPLRCVEIQQCVEQRG